MSEIRSQRTDRLSLSLTGEGGPHPEFMRTKDGRVRVLFGGQGHSTLTRRLRRRPLPLGRGELNSFFPRERKFICAEAM